jgi:ABC-2 type transport system permease protein
VLYRIWKLAIKEIIQLKRDKLFGPFVLLGPLLELLLVAWSTSVGIRHLPTAVLDGDRSAASRSLITAMVNSETFDPYMVDSLDQLSQDIELGRALAAWVIPPGFQEAVSRQSDDDVALQLIVDGADATSAQTAADVAAGLVAAYGVRATAQGLIAPQQAAGAQDLSLRVWFNEEMKEANFVIPSELGFIAAAVAAMVASMAIARERELGTLEQLMVTPLRTAELVIGKSVVAILLGYAEFLLMLGMVVWLFDLPMRGSLPLLMVIAFFYMLVELGWGLGVSAVARTQMQALLITFAVVMVMVIFCGYVYPVETMPPVMRLVANLFPLKHWLIVFRGILLKGAGLATLWPNLLPIAGLGAVIYTGTILLLRRRRLE